MQLPTTTVGTPARPRNYVTYASLVATVGKIRAEFWDMLRLRTTISPDLQAISRLWTAGPAAGRATE